MANHAKAWDAKLLAYLLPRQNTVAGLPGGLTSPTTSSGTASATNCLGFAGGRPYVEIPLGRNDAGCSCLYSHELANPAIGSFTPVRN